MQVSYLDLELDQTLDENNHQAQKSCIKICIWIDFCVNEGETTVNVIGGEKTEEKFAISKLKSKEE